MLNKIFVCVFLFLLSPISSFGLQPNENGIEEAKKIIRAETIRAHIKYLSDDLLEGRAPGTRGGELAAKYIAAQFESFGLEPIGEHSNYFQNVPIVNAKVENASMVIQKENVQEVLKYGTEFTAQSGLAEPNVMIENTDLVFVGYGITAPEYNWDDYKDVNVKGKIVIIMVNDPYSEDPNFFGGKAMTYYGRWTYKYEEAARRGAIGVLLIHTTESASYPWQVVQSSNTGNRSELVRDSASSPVVTLKSWISHEAASRILKLDNKDLLSLESQSNERNFKPVILNSKINVKIKSQISYLNSPNVAGLVKGSDPKLKNEYVIFTAHYDHLGIREENPGDKIYNGALDNASGSAALLAIAEATSKMKTPPKRSILFLSVTAEEQGLLGSQYYAEHPLFPLLSTAANINVDGINVYGPTRDFIPMGAERSSLGELIGQVAKKLNLTMEPDQFPEKGSFFRSDHFCFAKVGVPCVSLSGGVEIIGKPKGFGKEKEKEYVKTDYHQPSDEIKSDWDFSGAQQHAQFAFLVTMEVANQLTMPEWKKGEAFKNVRDAMLKNK